MYVCLYMYVCIYTYLDPAVRINPKIKLILQDWDKSTLAAREAVVVLLRVSLSPSIRL